MTEKCNCDPCTCAPECRCGTTAKGCGCGDTCQCGPNCGCEA